MEELPSEGLPPEEVAVSAEDEHEVAPCAPDEPTPTHTPRELPPSGSSTPSGAGVPHFAALSTPSVEGLTLELLLSRDHDRPGTHPFVRLGNDGLFANVYLARIASAAGRTLRLLALKIQRDAYDNEADSSAGATALVTNPTIETLWQQEWERLRACADDPAPSSLARLIELFPATDDRAPVFEPVLFSRKHKAFFPIPCPRGKGQLTDCTDDALLARHRLPEYRESNVRYLYSPGLLASQPDADAVFYRLHPSERDEERGVQGFDGLLRQLAESEAGQDDAPLAPWNEPALGEQTVDERVETLLDDLVPLSFHRFRLFPLEVGRLRYHEFVACLGGMEWNEFVESFRGPRTNEADELLLHDLRERLDRRSGWSFAGDAQGREALEILHLKVTLFQQVVDAVRTFHERFEVPHLDVRPDNLLVDLPPARSTVANWSTFQATLIDLPGTTFLDLGAGRAIARPPANYNELYTSPAVSGIQFGHMHRGDLVIEGLNTTDEGTTARIRLRSDLITSRDHTARDTLRFTFKTAATGGRAQFWARMEGATWSDDGREFALETLPAPINERSLAALESLRGRWQQNAPYEMYHAIHYASDVYSLGVLLFQTLLGNRELRMGDVRRGLIDSIADHVTRYERENPGVDAADLYAYVQRHLSDHSLAGKHNVHHDANPGRPNAIPEDVWTDLLLLGMRMVTHVPGFSVCEDRSAPTHDARTPLVDVALDVAELRSRIHAQLFGRPTVDADEIHEALDILRREP